MALNRTNAFPGFNRSETIDNSTQEIKRKMANNQPVTRPENMLPIMIVLGVMFLGICIAMNLFSRARFKKRANAFAMAGRATPSRRTNRGPGSIQRLESLYSASPLPQQLAAVGQATSMKSANHSGKSSISNTTTPATLGNGDKFDQSYEWRN